MTQAVTQDVPDVTVKLVVNQQLSCLHNYTLTMADMKAIESADLILTRSELSDVPRAIRLSRLTIRNIRQNLFWAFCYNSICIPVAAGALYPAFHILLTPMIAGAAMSLSSLCVVSNALRLRTKKL